MPVEQRRQTVEQSGGGVGCPVESRGRRGDLAVGALSEGGAHRQRQAPPMAVPVEEQAPLVLGLGEDLVAESERCGERPACRHPSGLELDGSRLRVVCGGRREQRQSGVAPVRSIPRCSGACGARGCARIEGGQGPVEAAGPLEQIASHGLVGRGRDQGFENREPLQGLERARGRGRLQNALHLVPNPLARDARQVWRGGSRRRGGARLDFEAFEQEAEASQSKHPQRVPREAVRLGGPQRSGGQILDPPERVFETVVGVGSVERASDGVDGQVPAREIRAQGLALSVPDIGLEGARHHPVGREAIASEDDRSSPAGAGQPAREPLAPFGDREVQISAVAAQQRVANDAAHRVDRRCPGGGFEVGRERVPAEAVESGGCAQGPCIVTAAATICRPRVRELRFHWRMKVVTSLSKGFFCSPERPVRGAPAVALILGFCALLALPAAAGTYRAQIEPGVIAALTPERDLLLEAEPRRGEGLLGFALRFCGEREAIETISAANGGAARLLTGVRYRIPYAALRGEWQLRLVRALFSRDYAAATGWYHEVGSLRTYGEGSLWHVAEWFTGRGDNYRAIRIENGLREDELAPGQAVLIPARLLRPALRAELPPSSPYYIRYDRDEKGTFAVYRIKPGEALYSSVVVRFTGRVFSDDVNALAAMIASRSGIDRVTAIPIGYEIKIPLELLEPEFLPANDPRRREYEAGLEASSRYRNSVTAKRLAGVTVILDSGHGGSDVGASVGDVWESVYVYDVMVRVKKLLESQTAAVVRPTMRDGASHKIVDADVLPASRQHTVLTNPRYLVEDSTVGLHLRWYLANSFLRQIRKAEGDADKVVFLSIHADSLHPSLRGGMAYIPGARFGKGSYGREGLVYASRREVREQPRVTFSNRDLVRSEGLSRDLAESLIDAFGARGLAVHPDKPVREKIVRQHREWLPAVLRYNAVPSKVLLEICNLANAEDRELLQTRAFRQKVAESIVDGIIAYYGDTRAPESLWAAATAR